MIWQRELPCPELYQPAFYKADLPVVCTTAHGQYHGTMFSLSRYLNFHTDCHFEDGFRRQEEMTRADKSGYGIVNTTLIAKHFLKGYEGLELAGISLQSV